VRDDEAVTDQPVIRYERPVQARATVRGVLALQLLANGAGALVVLLYLKVVFPDVSPADGEAQDLNSLVFGLYLLVTVGVTVPINKRFLMKAMRWVRDGREPTPLERWATLTQPLQQTLSAFLVWVGAAIIFGVVNQSQANSLRVAAGIMLAGLITCSLLELLLDRHFRPVFALALQNATLPRWRREILTRVMLAWWLGSAVPLIAIGLVPVGADASEVARSGTRMTVLLITGIIAGGLIMRTAAGAVSQPIEVVTDALAKIEEGDLEVHIDVSHIGEIGRLQHGVNSMVDGLREHRRLQDLFGRQVGTDVARRAVERDPQLGGEAREITALFVDLENFTAFTENHTPEEVVTELNAFFAIVIRVVMREGGWINKFEGDAALCIFGAPADQPDHAVRALRAAAALPHEVAELPEAPGVGIGVATGTVVAGNIGTAERYEYTVIGDAVNVAARLTELAKREYDGVLASEDTIVAAGEAAGAWREVGNVVVRGRTQPTRMFAPVD
jgi:adenylate cyclase